MASFPLPVEYKIVRNVQSVRTYVTELAQSNTPIDTVTYTWVIIERWVVCCSHQLRSVDRCTRSNTVCNCESVLLRYDAMVWLDGCVVRTATLWVVSLVFHKTYCHFTSGPICLPSLMVMMSSEVQGSSSSRRQQRSRWAIVCGSPQSQLTDCCQSRPTSSSLSLHGQSQCADGSANASRATVGETLLVGIQLPLTPIR